MSIELRILNLPSLFCPVSSYSPPNFWPRGWGVLPLLGSEPPPRKWVPLARGAWFKKNFRNLKTLVRVRERLDFFRKLKSAKKFRITFLNRPEIGVFRSQFLRESFWQNWYGAIGLDFV